MEINKIDKIIYKSFKNRTLQPSASAWERLSNQLNNQEEQKKKNWFLYVGYVASFLLLVTLGFFMVFNDDDQKPIVPNTTIVLQPVDTSLIQHNLTKQKSIEKAIVKVDKPLITKKAVRKNSSLKIDKTIKVNVNSVADKMWANSKKENTGLVTEFNNPKKEAILKLKTSAKDNQVIKTAKSLIAPKVVKTNGITVNSEDLLFAVTHSKEEVQAYYAKYNVDRDIILETIQKELNKSNLKINPNTILAEVERDIDEDTFKNNFIKSIKKRVANIATAIASRNN